MSCGQFIVGRNVKSPHELVINLKIEIEMDVTMDMDMNKNKKTERIRPSTGLFFSATSSLSKISIVLRLTTLF
jgi:hypothetical protein